MAIAIQQYGLWILVATIPIYFMAWSWESFDENCVGDCHNGKGIYTWDDGDVYDGEWKDGMRNGYGIKLVAGTAERYEGQFKNDAKHGRGTYTYESGNKYEGDWLDDQKSGQGVMTRPDGSVIFDGEWFDAHLG